MAKIEWDKTGEHFYQTGTGHGVLYVGRLDNTAEDTGTKYGNGVAWNGLTAVTESPSGAEANPMYADNIKYLNLFSVEEFGATIEAYTYPEEFEACDGIKNVGGVKIYGQARKEFAFCYRTLVGNDTDPATATDRHSIIHLVYGAKASPAERAYTTVNDSPEAMTLSWEITTVPEKETIDGVEYIYAHLEIDLSKKASGGSGYEVSDAAMKALTDFLYGGTSTEAKIPTLAKLKELLATSETSSASGGSGGQGGGGDQGGSGGFNPGVGS